MEKSVSVLTFEQFQGKKNIGSTRIRVSWLLPHWEEAEEYRMGRMYETVILQKAYWLEGLEELEKYAPGKHIKILDICDADWLHWGYRIKQILDLCDAVTTSTIAQAEFLVKYTDKPVWCIPDRLALEEFGTLKKDHTGKGTAKIAVWYGYSENFPMLDAAVNALVEVGIEELIVIANKRSPYVLPASVAKKLRLINLPWTAETYNSDILKGDIVINPTSQKGRWKYKSNNKTINAWALGMPVAASKEELLQFITEESRIAEGNSRYEQMRRENNVVESVNEFRNLIKELKESKGL